MNSLRLHSFAFGWLLPGLFLQFLFSGESLAQDKSTDLGDALKEQDPWKVNYEILEVLSQTPSRVDSLLQWTGGESPNGHNEKTGRIFTLLAQLAEKNGDFSQSLQYHLKALPIYEAAGIKAFQAFTLFRIGLIKRNYFEDNKTAMQYYSRYLMTSKEISDTLNIARGLQNMANVYRDEGQPEEAVKHFLEAVKLINLLCETVSTKTDFSRQKMWFDRRADIHFDFGKHFEILQDYPEAIRQFSEAVRVGQHTNFVFARALQRLGAVHFELKQYERALDYSHQAKRASEYDSMWATRAEATYTLYKIYLTQENYPKALENYGFFHESREKARVADAISKLRMRFETDEKEKELALLEQEKNAKQFERNAFIVGILLVFIIAILVYNRQRMKISNEEKELKLKSEQLEIYTHNLLEKNQLVEKLKIEVEELRGSVGPFEPKVEDLNQVLNATILTDQDWEEFKRLFGQVHQVFFTKLKVKLPDLSLAETRLAALLKLRLGTKEIAHMLAISPESVNKSRYRLRKKLELPQEADLEDFIQKL